ncbi:hypothetical protein [Aliidiomarina haloalkalitolerans]|uniref:hypothetical protein n=1 Tax=Aliidiomarina haloalkalitolerans TaxID=859059 RepID=UPI000F897489|nr:hypothetical protein [Aliidiomarina haloalkalitolerans]
MFKKIESIPRRYRLAFLLALFVMTHLIWGTEMLRYFGGWTLLLFVMFPETLVTKIPADKTKDMLRLLSREDDRLRVGMEQVALSVVKKVALSEYNDKYAMLSFPYTGKISSNYVFPIEQMNDVRAWLQTHTPELEIIT